MTEESLARPSITVRSWSIAAPFMLLEEIPTNARHLLALASNLRIHGINIYKAMANEEIAKTLCISHGVLMRAKKVLRDQELLFYDGAFGDLTFLKERWKRRHREEWGFDL